MGETLSESERLAIRWRILSVLEEHDVVETAERGPLSVGLSHFLAPTVARIVAERVRAVEGERDSAVARLGRVVEHFDVMGNGIEPDEFTAGQRKAYRDASMWLRAALGGDQGREGPQEGAGGGMEGLGDGELGDRP